MQDLKRWTKARLIEKLTELTIANGELARISNSATSEPVLVQKKLEKSESDNGSLKRAIELIREEKRQLVEAIEVRVAQTAGRADGLAEALRILTTAK